MTDNREICHTCGSTVELVSREEEVRIGSRSAMVQDEFYRCEACETEFYAPGQMQATQRRAADQIRRENGLLLPQEILAIREGLGLSQAQFEKLLGVGPKTVVRWERGTVFQNGSTDALLRVVLANRHNAEFLAERHGVALPLPDVGGPQEPAVDEVTYTDTPARGRAERRRANAFWSGQQPLVVTLHLDDVSDSTEAVRCA